ncbi:MAG: hypothetical protein A3D92_09970 [Bacteroidetes bacterium RIFCSPHIGHO2_02_FULL_44_7]|nr:MAG: hypothetical protein A3D92_09970 [Bacteroidetes bacterium RIFCSPHIGHO2_02_FULL_44_7]
MVVAGKFVVAGEVALVEDVEIGDGETGNMEVDAVVADTAVVVVAFVWFAIIVGHDDEVQ